MIQQMLKNEQLKGMNFPGIGPQMMASMMPPADLFKQPYYQNLLRGMAQQPQIPIQPKRNAPIHNLT